MNNKFRILLSLLISYILLLFISNQNCIEEPVEIIDHSNITTVSILELYNGFYYDVYIQNGFGYILPMYEPNIFIADLDNPSNPTYITSEGFDIYYTSDFLDLYGFDEILLMTSSDIDLSIYSLGNNTNPQFVSHINNIDIDNWGERIFVRDNLAFIKKEDSLELIDISDINNPYNVKSVTIQESEDYSFILDIVYYLNYVYIVSNENEVLIINVENPEDAFIEEIFTFDTLETINSLYNYKNHLYVAIRKAIDKKKGLLVYDITDPLNPSYINYLIQNEYVYSINILNDIAFIATESNEEDLIVLDISDLHNPIILERFESINTDGGYLYLLLQDDYAYCMGCEFNIDELIWSCYLETLDISYYINQ